MCRCARSPQGFGQFAGAVAEIRFYGWSVSDESMADIGVPKNVSIIVGTTRNIIRYDAAVKADEIRIERRLRGNAEWTLVSTVASSVGEFVDSGLNAKTEYEYRLVAQGLGGRIESASEIYSVTTLPSGINFILR